MSAELRIAAEEFGSPGLLRQNAAKWGYSQLGFLSDGISHAVGSRIGFRPMYQCDYCMCCVGIRGGGPFGDKCPLVVHMLHCTAVSFGVRYFRSRRKDE